MVYVRQLLIILCLFLQIAMQLISVLVLYGIDLQNLHPMDVDYSWLRRIPNFYDNSHDDHYLQAAVSRAVDTDAISCAGDCCVSCTADTVSWRRRQRHRSVVVSKPSYTASQSQTYTNHLLLINRWQMISFTCPQCLMSTTAAIHFNGQYSRATWVGWYQNVKPFWFCCTRYNRGSGSTDGNF